MFLQILQVIWQLGIIIWFAYSTVFTFRALVIKLKEKRKEKKENEELHNKK